MPEQPIDPPKRQGMWAGRPTTMAYFVARAVAVIVTCAFGVYCISRGQSPGWGFGALIAVLIWF